MSSRSSLAAGCARVEHAFVPPDLRGDPVASRTASLVVGFSLLPILFVPVLAIMEWVAFPPEIADRTVWLVLASAPICAAVPFVLRATGSTRSPGNLMVAYGFLLFAIFGYYAGGVLVAPQLLERAPADDRARAGRPARRGVLDRGGAARGVRGRLARTARPAASTTTFCPSGGPCTGS